MHPELQVSFQLDQSVVEEPLILIIEEDARPDRNRFVVFVPSFDTDAIIDPEELEDAPIIRVYSLEDKLAVDLHAGNPGRAALGLPSSHRSEEIWIWLFFES